MLSSLAEDLPKIAQLSFAIASAYFSSPAGLLLKSINTEEALPDTNSAVCPGLGKARNGSFRVNRICNVVYRPSESRPDSPGGCVTTVAGDVGAATACRCITGGAEGNRTPDLLKAIQALSQLSYGPDR